MGMRVEISSELRDRILAETSAAPRVEICGLLLGRGAQVTAIASCRNVALDPTRRFEIDPAALLAAHRHARVGGPDVVGHYHSHPSGLAEPSPRDAADAAMDGAIWIVAAGDRLTAWRAVADGPLYGRFEPLDL
jgi:proteasome lid subunit RPN8/RPN11